ncbi:hypothetical protein A3A64_02705 [Candidatus Gottesmanbacteria bacterium RIFCSPLOWO2_01_FULL_48_11]|uniref:Aspartate ammonia-lyase n=2 Tax=Candidatus Gottesmaniibacteriota TaxID=1752720 RepID=A0A0G1U049_9BACT|nr:MAG: Aspartate ammonia-lyase [Candidatus Gottesmanbacteria bacterium GW2011_GWA2_47_9]OGG27942.1 MAG: hypothetical protein A3A64_02705 [Candidatus Gottesmanbacteria bacterium RIFCSPLOWO2_01_FULL_48_11]
MNVYYGEETKRSVANFPFSVHHVHLELIYAIAEIKKAAAVANLADRGISKEISEAIVAAGEEILSKKLDDQFVTPALQGGAGTSINMNVCEVLAGRATELLSEKGLSTTVHPLDHVNKSQSTNDVNPSALKIASLRLLRQLISAVEKLQAALEKKSKEFQPIVKLARTHLQDAVPMTLGDEFGSYAAIVGRQLRYLKDIEPYLLELNLGGTAIGNSINASETYRKVIYGELSNNTGLPLEPAENFMSQTSSQADFVALSHALVAYFVDISKIANDIRMMASGPKGGFAELKLPEMQKGSTIMPGKVNPVIPEVVNQTYYLVSGYSVTVTMAARAAQFELANMLPVVADVLITALKITREATELFTNKCIAVVEANEENCRKHLEESTAYATLLTPRLGYDTVSAIVKESIKTGKTLRELVLEKKMLTEKEFDAIVKSIER